MTDPHPQRCENGCTLYHYDDEIHVRKCNGIIMPGCDSDCCVFEWIKTHGCATHTHTPAPATEPGCPHWKDARNLKSDFRDQIKGDHYCDLPTPEQAAQAAREQVLDELESLINSGKCPPGKNNYECGDNCEACCIEYVRESLRRGGAP